MGRARQRKPTRRGLSRRDFMLRAGLASAALGAAPLLGTSAAAAAPAANGKRTATAATSGVFLHGVASGDPLSDRVMLWTRVTQAGTAPVNVSWLLASDPALTQVVAAGIATAAADRDFTVKLDADGLQPATTYYYQFSALGQSSPIGRTRTLPVGDVDRLRIGVAVCSSLAHGYFNAYARLAERSDLDLVVHLGDYIYEYATGEYGDVRAYEPSHEIVTLDDYRTRHAQYKTDADLQELHRQHPVVAIWDDHEFANNASSVGAQNHDPATEGSWSTRVAVASQAYYEWMPTRVPDATNLLKNYRRFQLGSLADLTMLEERVGARSLQANFRGEVSDTDFGPYRQVGDMADPSRQMLGTAEEDWLFSSLRSSTAKWKLIGQGVMFAQLKLVGAPNATNTSVYLNSDQWDGYAPARQRIFDVLKGDAEHAPVRNVALLTGDIHSAFACELAPDPNNPVVRRGGYNPLTGAGALAAEFVTTSVTSPGFDQLQPLAPTLKQINPHIKYVDLNNRGYMLLDVTTQQLACEYWQVDTVTQPSPNQRFAIAFKLLPGSSKLHRTSQSQPRSNPPAPAP